MAHVEAICMPRLASRSVPWTAWPLTRNQSLRNSGTSCIHQRPGGNPAALEDIETSSVPSSVYAYGHTPATASE